MKSVYLKLLFALAVIFSTNITARADKGIYIPPVAVTPGETFNLPVWLDNDKPYLGLQLDITLPEGLDFALSNKGKLVVTLNEDKIDDHGPASGLFEENPKWGRVAVVSFTNSEIPVGNDLLLTVRVKVSEDFKGVQTGQLSKLLLSPTPGTEDKYPDSEFTVYVAVTSLTLDKHELSMDVGDSETLSVELNPAAAEGTPITWTVSDPEILSVEDGKVTALAAGTATVTATAGDKSDSCEVTVKQLATSITLNETEAVIETDEELQLVATVLPEDTTDKTVAWSSSNEAVATVEDGLVTAVSPGTVTITATTTDGSNLSATCELTVNVASGVERIAVDGKMDIYDACGRLLMKDAAAEALASLKKGVYVIVAGDRSYKLVK